MTPPSGSELLQALECMGRPRVLVLGDVMIDDYVFGRVERISPEAPIAVLNVEREEQRPGGAGSVVGMLRRLGAAVRLLAVTGDDAAGDLLASLLARQGVELDGLVRDPARPTTRKTRMIAHDQQVLRVDRERAAPLGAELEKTLIERLAAALDGVDVVLVSDYAKGLVTPGLLAALRTEADRRGIGWIVDPARGRDYALYRGASAITPNRAETAEASGERPADRASWERIGRRFVETLELECALLTLDRDGIFCVPRDGEPLHVPTEPRQVYDVTGAGDMVLATIGLARAAGLDWAVAAELANVAAGIEIRRIGVAPVSREEIAAEIRSRGEPEAHKIISLEAFVGGPLEELRRSGKRVVFTNGCFDLLHVGHVKMLQFARAQGEHLVVGLNSDRSVRQLKGPGRPILAEQDRARMLAAIGAVDHVIVFDEPTPLALIEAIVPDVLVKASDYEGRPVVGRSIVEAAGGQVVLAPLVGGVSTTRIVERLQQVERGAAQAARRAAQALYAQVERAAEGRVGERREETP
ncbi:MAG: D-glycero-beta-D-manno-heptose 1-phosphate adenylyltransferase [Planctomycetota bacterium]|nr:MAG: D-glycero-beta-D-manno-heptose 1-phosphate adenylyltransferase [Planctomycetota bacterium]